VNKGKVDPKTVQGMLRHTHLLFIWTLSRQRAGRFLLDFLSAMHWRPLLCEIGTPPSPLGAD
jgi:hypothetical protein